MQQIKTWEHHKGAAYETVSGIDVIDCETCGFKHIIPIPTDEELETYYSETFVEERPLYIDRIEEDLVWWKTVYADHYDNFEKLLAPDRRKILEVGCGLGHFLEFGKNRGWEVMGIEPSRKSAAYAGQLGIDVLNVMLTQENADSLGTFDVVYLQEVLEHVNDADGFIKILKNLIRPGGLICIAVPNEYNPLQLGLIKSLGYDPWWVSRLHINYFDFESLGNLLTQNGFNIELQTTSFPMEFFLYMNRKYVGNDELGRKCHSLRKEFELNMNKSGNNKLKRGLYESLARLNIGRECIFIGKLI